MTKIYRVQMNAKGMPNFSTAEEVADRPKGKWRENNPSVKGLGSVYKCSLCGYEVDCVPTNYCPNCGADMRGEDNETD